VLLFAANGEAAEGLETLLMSELRCQSPDSP
jgi:hypothetical protein